MAFLEKSIFLVENRDSVYNVFIWCQDELDEEFQQRLAEHKQAAVARTDKKRAKRLVTVFSAFYCKPLMYACPLFRDFCNSVEIAKFKGVNIKFRILENSTSLKKRFGCIHFSSMTLPGNSWSYLAGKLSCDITTIISTQHCILLGSLNRVPASPGSKCGKSPLPGGM